MRRNLKTYVWMKDIERRKKDRRKKVADGIMLEDYDRRKEEEKDECGSSNEISSLVGSICVLHIADCSGGRY